MTESQSIEEIIEEIRLLKKWLTCTIALVVLISIYLGVPAITGVLVFIANNLTANPILIFVGLVIVGISALVLILILYDQKLDQ
jgi:hypothetical protein